MRARLNIARRTLLVALTVAPAVLAGSVSMGQESPVLYKIIVHPSNPATRLGRRFLAEAFLKKARYWPDDTEIQPVDLRPDASVRSEFTRDILGRTVGAVRSYWQQAIFSGRDVPPPELETDAMVLEYVLRRPGALGYVSADTFVRDARVVMIK